MLLHYEHGDAHPGVEQVEQEILAVDVVDVAVIGIGPIGRPRIDEHEIVAAIFDRLLVVHDYRPADSEGMLAAKVRPEFIVRDVSALARGMQIA